jgi:GDPmannose 4,6-dehydratase
MNYLYEFHGNSFILLPTMDQTTPPRVALITGVTGQDGSYLCEFLLAKGYTVHGVVRRTSNLQRLRVEHLRNMPDVYGKSFFLHYGDLSDPTTLRRIIHTLRPDEIYHLAGQSHVGLSFEIPESTCEAVAMATLRLLEICRDEPYPIRFYHAATSEIFGSVTESPQTEETAYRPSSPYGCAKAFATDMARVYRTGYHLFACNGILYNHESPRRSENFVTRKISRQVALIKLGQADRLVLGSVEGRRDWGHARDYVQAMWLMLQHPEPDDYVVATGQTHSVLDFVKAAFAVVDMDWEKYLEYDKSIERPTEPYKLVGDATKIKKTLGWKPSGTFDGLVREMVEFDLADLGPR